jgi:GAF domain-containing protein
MYQLDVPVTGTKSELYTSAAQQLSALMYEESDAIANAANASSLLFHLLPDLNWVGFYFLRVDQLVLGPFQGKPACIRIPLGKGVCGTAAERRETLVVHDVRAFAGHIACDAASNSEIVVPLLKDGRLIGVLDLDSPLAGRFDEEDRIGLEALAQLYVEASDVTWLVRK